MPDSQNNAEADVVDAPIANNLVGSADPVGVIERTSRLATALAKLINDRELYTVIQKKKYVHLDGWQVAGAMLGVTAIVTVTERIEDGWKARAEARTFDGQVIGAADSICTRTEKRGPWKSAEDYAICAMAQTRAMSRALRGPLGFIVKLAGYESTTAEDAVAIDAAPAPAKAKPQAPTKSQQATIGGLLDTLNLDDNTVQLEVAAVGGDALDTLTRPQAENFIKRLEARDA